MNPSCTSITCRATNLTAYSQELTAVFSVDPNCQEPADLYFSLRDRALGTSLFNQSVTDCFSILQQDQVEFTLGPLPVDVENVTFSLTQPTNETTLLTLLVSWLHVIIDTVSLRHLARHAHNYGLISGCCEVLQNSYMYLLEYISIASQ